jgi:kumamolisin
VCRGDLGVRSFGDAPAGSQLKIGSDIFIQPNHSLFAPSVLVGRNVTLGAVQTDQLTDDGIRLGTATLFPATAMPPLPLAAATAGGGPNIFVGSDQVLALPSGNYGAVRVDGFLALNPGLYSVSKLEVGDFGRIIAIAGNVRMTVVSTLVAGRHTEIHPALGLAAEHFRISVAGSDVNGQPAASIGEHSRVRALLVAPHGTLAFADDVRATGAFAAFDMAIGSSARVAFQNGFPADVPGDHGSQLLSGYFAVSPDPSVAAFVGPVPNDTNIHLAISLPVRDPAGLKTFVQQVSDPNSPNFRKHLTQDQFYATHGATASDYQALQDWARTASGFTITATYPNNLLLSVTGTTAQIEQALHVNLVFRQRKDRSAFVAVDREPSIDLAVPILQISGLTDYVLPKHLAVNGTGGSGGGGTAFARTSYRAADLRNAYLGLGSNCQSLDGTGQVIGIVGFDVFAKSDIDGYDSAQLPPITNHASVVFTVLGQFVPSGANREATLDVEMAQAIAPGATILFFMEATETTLGVPNGHIDEVFNAMATSTPPLTVASSSLTFKPSDTAQQAIDEMAAQGVSFFQGSGDFGDVGDPQNNMRMDHQTLVGGTLLSTNPLIAGLPNPVYPNNYYAGETVWTEGLPPKSKDVSGGGIMDGNNKNGDCVIFCGDPVPIPDYQVGVSGLTRFRNYPDVAMAADNVEIFFQGTTEVSGGTSAAAPLWAGFAALVNQRSAQNSAGLMGFLNPTLYAIGLTRGSPTDLYSNSFNDITSGNNANGFGSGFNALPGYDLVTGWGSPTCQLVNQLATLTPLDPNTPLSLIRFTIVTGNDDAGGGLNGSMQTADVLLQDGSSFSVTLRLPIDPHWDNGSTHDLTFPIPSSVNPPLTQSHGIAGVRINLIQDNPDIAADNWDIADVFVNLLNPGSPQVCQLFLVGTSKLQDGSTGLVRLSKNPGGSGVGRSKEFATGAASGCVEP